MTNLQRTRWRAMMSEARPMVARDEDYQAVQHHLLDHFDFLTGTDEDAELTLDVVRACEDEILERD